MLKLWDDILTEFNKVSKSLQATEIDVSLAVKLYDSPIRHVSQQRERFAYYEKYGKELRNCSTYKSDNKRKK